MGVPNIYTQTPIESVIIAYGLKVQEALASVFIGTPIFKSIAILFFAFVIITSFMKMNKGEINQSQLIYKCVIQLFSFVIAFTIIGNGSSGIKFASSGENKSWASYSKISADPKFSSLNSDTNGLQWYLIIYRGFQEFSNVVTDALSTAFNDPSMSKDPSFLYKTLGNAAIKGLDDSQTAIAFNALLRDCADTRSGKVLDKKSSLKDIFDLNKPGCLAEWGTFNTNLNRISDVYRNAYSEPAYHDVYFGSLNGLNGNVLANIATANAVVNHLRVLSGETTGGLNKTNNATATYSESTRDQVAQIADNPVRNIAAYVVNMLGFSDKDAFETLNKAEVSSVFNQVAYLIPVTRAVFQVILSVVFLLVVLAVACGFYKPFTAWLSSMFLISMYQPISVFVYKIPVFFQNQAAFLNNSETISSDPLLLVGARLLDDQITQMQTVCIALQISVFAMCLFGAVKLIGFSNHVTGKFGAGITSYGERAISGISSIGSSHSRSSNSFQGGSDGVSGITASKTNV